MSTRNSILFLSTSIGWGESCHYGGGEHFAREFIESVSRRGWKVTLVCPPNSPFLKDPALMSILEASEILDLSVKISEFPKFPIIMLRWLRWIHSRNFSIIYANGYESLKWAAAAAATSKQIAVTHLHESTYEHYDSWRTRLLSKAIDRFFAISADVFLVFTQRAKVPSLKVKVIPNGIPVPAVTSGSSAERMVTRCQLSITADQPLIVMVARTDPHKGHEIFVKAAALVSKTIDSAHFVIAGFQKGPAKECALYEDILHLIESCGIEPKLTTIDYCDDVRRLMRGADIVVVPSTSEGFGRTAIEAMAEGVPVIASRVGGLAEIITDGHDGIQVPPGDSRALAAAIIKLLQDTSTQEKLAKNGRQTVLERYSIEKMTDLIEKNMLEAISLQKASHK